MGNEQSQSSGIQIEKQAVKVSNFWSQHAAIISESNQAINICVFIEKLSEYKTAPFWVPLTPFQRYIKVGMLHN